MPTGILGAPINRLLKRHLLEMAMELGHVSTALTADKPDLAKHFGGILFGGERPVAILQVLGRDLHIFGYFDKPGAVAALLAGNAANRFTGGDLHFFHRFCHLSCSGYSQLLLCQRIIDNLQRVHPKKTEW